MMGNVLLSVGRLLANNVFGFMAISKACELHCFVGLSVEKVGSSN